MCGIAGIISFEKPLDAETVARMGEAMAHRGPDGHWNWMSDDARCGFVYRRLAIMDPQHYLYEPFVWEKRYLVLYNGEIYNHRELRDELIQKKYSFSGTSDAEVLPALYHAYGEAFLEKVDGMFAFALWDLERHELFCARDRFGEKPLFFALHDRRFYFTSELKSLRDAGLALDADDRMTYLYVAHNMVENPNDLSQTFYKGIKRMPPATWMRVTRDGNVTRQTYWQLKPKTNPKISLDEAVQTFQHMFRESVQRRLIADADVGCDISGGLDSSAVLAAMKRFRGSDLKTFTARMRDDKLDEGPYVATLLKKIPAQNFETWIDANSLLQHLDATLQTQDEPVTDLTVVAQYMLMKLAKDHGMRVLLDGQGSDEILAGYDHLFLPYLREQRRKSKQHYRQALNDYQTTHDKPYRASRNFWMSAAMPSLHGTVQTMRNFVNPSLLDFIDRDFSKAYSHAAPPENFRTLNDALLYRTTSYGLHKLLRYADRNSMAHGIELRLPFLHYKMVEFLFSLPGDYKIHEGWSKYLLRRAVDDELPKEITWRKNKLGYTMPVNVWMQNARAQAMIKEAKHHLVTRKVVKPNATLNAQQATAVLIASRFIK